MTLNIAKSAELGSKPVLDFAQREKEIRAWIARKESVCPYAPGLARFVYLPEINEIKIEHVHYLARELKAFYSDKNNGKRVGRWMLLPSREWQSHDEAKAFSERIFWLLNAAYYHLIRDKKSVKAALRQDIPGYIRGYKGEIVNPIVGKLPKRNSDIVPARSLFCSALSPLYNSKTFYRYCPHSVMPLVYAAEFDDLKRKNPQVTESVTFDMAYGGLYELFGDDLELDLEVFRAELPMWGAIIDRVAELMREPSSGTCSSVQSSSPPNNLSYFRRCQPQLINAFYSKYISDLSILRSIVRRTRATPKQVIAAAFAGSGLYTIPDYSSLEESTKQYNR